MKRLFNKIVLSAAIALTSLSVFAFSTSMTLQPGGFTNFPTPVNGSPVKVTSVTITGSATNVANLKFIDTYTNSLVYTNGVYTNVISYATNIVSSFVNYYGVTTLNTNAQLIDVANTVPANTNNFNIPIAVVCPTNGSISMPLVNYYFANGIWVTNTTAGSSGPATITVTFQQ